MRTRDPRPGRQDDEAHGQPPSPEDHLSPLWEASDDGGERYAFEVGETLGMELGEMLRGYDSESLVADLGPPGALAHRLLEAVPKPSPWNDALGPFYDSRQMAAFLGGISRQALAERRKRRTVLALETADSVIVYPTFQLGTGGSILPGLAETLKAFEPDEVDGWTIAGWLVAEHHELGDRTAIAWLEERRDPSVLVELARTATGRFAA